MKNYLLTVLTTFCLTVPQACTTPQSPQKINAEIGNNKRDKKKKGKRKKRSRHTTLFRERFDKQWRRPQQNSERLGRYGLYQCGSC